ncbi:MarR family transcriptional regulator [Rhodococcoides fascians]|uniref:MarR family winged helix-turn-helix transcriptional regulator n=1 Tax=Rhodococcoides fascians TaxID=1828 RepID=UPI002ACE3CE2|nr:MarR family transcriptional regulator [Rhodococcus fascians]WQH28789.1 MarR family transcriptional regulator [Rhodococcus fascians]
MRVTNPARGAFRLLPQAPTGDWRIDKERPPLGTLAGVLNRALIYRVSQKIEQCGGEVSRPSHLYVLRALGNSGASVTELADLCEVTKQAISQVLHVFEKKALVTRKPDPSDGRGKIVVLTHRGEQALAAAVLAWGEIEAEWADLLGGPEEMHKVREAMFNFVEKYGDYHLGDQQPRMRPVW